MTALNFLVEDSQICFAMDTLMVSAEDRTPLRFVTKFELLPHLHTAVTGTGHGGLVSSWMAFARESIVATEIDHLNQYVTTALQEIAADFPELLELTATIYHFGYSQQREKYTAYAYRSTKGFESEELQGGIGIKPQIDSMDPLGEFTLPAKFIELMEIQQKQDLSLPQSDRVGIGGDIHFVHLAGGVMSVTTCHRFQNYQSDYDYICAQL